MTQEIAKDFLQCVAFVDDNAYSENGADHPFDSIAVQKAFANSELLCSVNRPESFEEALGYSKILSKADVIFLDWQMFKDAPKSSGDEEDDADVIEKGEITLSLLESLYEQKEETKLIFIYTGDNDFDGICEKIKSKCSGLKQLDGTFDLEFKKFKIKLVGKKASGSGFIPNAVVKDYSELPDLVLQEFENLNQGILPTYSVLALTQIRKNTGNIISHFSSDMDSAFLNHRIVLGDHEEALDHLSETFATTISSIVESITISRKLTQGFLNSHISQRLLGKTISFGKVNGQNIGDVQISNEIIDRWLKHDFLSVDFNSKELDRRKLLDSLVGKLTFILDPSNNSSDEKFAYFTQHKPEFLNRESQPVLTLGTVLKGDSKFFLCVQPRCDTLSRGAGQIISFIFLELVPISSERGLFEIVLFDSTFQRFKVNYKPSAVKTFDFSTSSGMGYVESRLNDQKEFEFYGMNGEKFVWKGTLSEAQSQRISNRFASQISRVGLNESEWLRRNSPNH